MSSIVVTDFELRAKESLPLLIRGNVLYINKRTKLPVGRSGSEEEITSRIIIPGGKLLLYCKITFGPKTQLVVVSSRHKTTFYLFNQHGKFYLNVENGVKRANASLWLLLTTVITRNDETTNLFRSQVKDLLKSYFNGRENEVRIILNTKDSTSIRIIKEPGAGKPVSVAVGDNELIPYCFDKSALVFKHCMHDCVDA